jgi:hypothetical protein
MTLQARIQWLKLMMILWMMLTMLMLLPTTADGTNADPAERPAEESENLLKGLSDDYYYDSFTPSIYAVYVLQRCSSVHVMFTFCAESKRVVMLH